MLLPDLDDLIQDLQLAKQMAIDDHNPNALVIATVAQAKLLGIDKPLKDVTPISHSDPKQPVDYSMLTDDYSMLTDDELRQLIAITEKMEKVIMHD